MKTNFIFRLLISFVILLNSPVIAKDYTFVSLSPALTEVMYAIGAQDSLKAVSTTCSYPADVKEKDVIGDTIFINEEKILSIKPDYILAPDSSGFATEKFSRMGITPLSFKNPDIKSIEENILSLGKLTGKTQNAQALVNNIENEIKKANLHHNKKILYLIQTNPMISIGNKSFITDIIEKSGNTSITKNLNYYYPVISEEFGISMHPDIIILSYWTDENRIKKLFPFAKIIFMTEEEKDIVNRPGPRIYESVKFFAQF